MPAAAEFPVLKTLAEKAGLFLTAALSRSTAESTLRSESDRLADWQRQGFAAEMSFMQRDPSLFAGFQKILPSARSVLLFIVPYAKKIRAPRECPPGYGRVARYAWGEDYHVALKDRLRAFSDLVRAEYGPFVSRTFSDAVPILERSLARKAGLGFVGRNAMLLRPGWGSFFFIAEFISDLEIATLPSDDDPSVDFASDRPGSGCGTCARCLAGCPTEAIVAPGIIDSRRCISFLTIEKRTAFDEWECRAIGDWLFGCDVCQEVCPFNQGVSRLEPPPEFCPENGAGEHLQLESILALRTDRQYEDRFASSAIMRVGRSGLLRNCCAVAANQRAFWLVDSLREAVQNDGSPLVRASAKRALQRLASDADGLDKMRLTSMLKTFQEQEPVEKGPAPVVI